MDFKSKLADFLRVKGIRIYFPQDYHLRLYRYVDREDPLCGIKFYRDFDDIAYVDTSRNLKDTIYRLLDFLYKGSIKFGLSFSLNYDYGTNELIVRMKEL